MSTHDAIEPVTVAEKVCAGVYEPATRLPAQPIKPALLSKRASDLTGDEIAQLPSVKAQYEDQIAARKEAIAKYSKEEDECLLRFRADLESEHGMSGHAKADAVFSLAWNEGHADGLSEVAGWYGRLVELVETTEIVR